MVQVIQHRRVQGPGETQDGELIDIAQGVIIAVVVFDVLYRFLRRMNDVEQVHVDRRNISPRQEFLLELAHEAFPVSAVFRFGEQNGARHAFAGLEQGEIFKSFIEGSEPSGEQDGGVRFLDEHQLAGEKIFELHQFGVAFDMEVGALFLGQFDVDAEAVFPSGAPVGGFHDASAGSGNDHMPLVDQCLCRVLRHPVTGIGFGRPCRAENHHLAFFAVGQEYPEGVAQFLEGVVGQLEVSPVLVLQAHFHHRRENFFYQVRRRVVAAEVHQVLDHLFGLGVPYAVIRFRHCTSPLNRLFLDR